MLRKKKDPKKFSTITISVASPEAILEHSHGEVTQPETINYRTYLPEMNGLFCERIFGPKKDWECHCGKYKRIRYQGIICDKCGVEVTEKKIRRERMGHIALVVPIVHLWYFRSLPNKIGYLLGLSTKKLDQIVYYERYIVIQAGILEEHGVQSMDFLNEESYEELLEKIPKDNQYLPDNDPKKCIIDMGGEAIKKLLQRIDLDTLSEQLRHQSLYDTAQQRRADALKRLKIVENFKVAQAKNLSNPAWMVLHILPVIPPDLRPLVALDGGKFATADLNDLYRKVIIRNNRLKKLIEKKAPAVILRNEKRMLQEAVDALFDSSKKANTVIGDTSKQLKSLSDLLKGKQGRFRQNLLGKRVDYSGRSVIVVGPKLQLHECGLPKEMAVELFKPIIIRRLIERGLVKTVKFAKKLIDQKLSVIWDILEKILPGYPVLLNRAPTLHKLGIQAFQPKLIEGKAIQLHPLVCTAFNADFDGDQMAVHIPLSQEAITEASLLLLSSHNILNPANGMPITVPSKDMLLGLYYLTKGRKSTEEHIVKGEGMIFTDAEEVSIALGNEKISQHALIKLRAHVLNEDGQLIVQMIETVAGRVIFNQYVPSEVGFINELLTNKNLQTIIAKIYQKTGIKRTVQFLDDIKTLGFQATHSGGLTMSLEDIKIPSQKPSLVKKAQAEIENIWNNYLMGLITDNERYNQVIDTWTRTSNKITAYLMDDLENDQGGFNSIFMMMHSGARGSREQARQLGGMRGLMAKPQKNLRGGVGEIIENPILSNFKEGIDVLEYFIATHGARKGLADTALKTADAGYLTRRLVDVAQDVIVSEKDCGTVKGIYIHPLRENEEIIEAISLRVIGRVTISDIFNPKDSNHLIVAQGQLIDAATAETIEKLGIEQVEVRSVLTCESPTGVCCQCYGRDIGKGTIIQLGDTVGVIAAQSIGEPGTQLTLRTFHVGGTASNIAVESKMSSKHEGKIFLDKTKVIEKKNDQGQKEWVVVDRLGELKILDDEDKVLSTQHIPYGAILTVAEGQKIDKGAMICYWDPYNAVIIATVSGTAIYDALEENITYKQEYDEQTGFVEKIIIDSKDKVKNPSIIIQSGDDEMPPTAYPMPVGAHLIANEKDTIQAGDILAKIPRQLSNAGDITGGLPRITELFEVRNTSNASAVVSTIDGIVKYGKIKRSSREVFIESKEGDQAKFSIPLSKHLLVQDQDYVNAGQALTDGSITLSDILSIQGTQAVQNYLVNEIQAVYRLQGVKIDDKHIEVIVRQMMQKVEVIHVGDTPFLQSQIITKKELKKAHDKLQSYCVITDPGGSKTLTTGQLITIEQWHYENIILENSKLDAIVTRPVRPAIVKPILQGITRASLGTDSFLSAASFQETNKVLSTAAIQAKTDNLKGLKENVIVGGLIKAGTGNRAYQNLLIGSKEAYQQLKNAESKTAS